MEKRAVIKVIASLVAIVFNSIPAANSQVGISYTFGVLKLNLHPDSYGWQFIPVAGQNLSDSGSAACH